MAKLLHIFYHKEGTFSLLCQQVQLITVSNLKEVILSILVYTFFSRMFDLMLPPVAKHSIVVA